MTQNPLLPNGRPVAKGVPRITSRDKIVEAGLALAAADPCTSVTVVSIARKLGIAPMAIYNYFPSKDSLMQELSARLLDRMEIAISEGAKPLEVTEIWARSARAHFTRHPEVLRIIGYENGYSSDAWFAKSKPLFEAMEALGFSGEELIKVIRWFWNTIMSAITVEIQESMASAPSMERVDERFDSYVGDAFKVLNEVSRDMFFYDRLFDFHVEMMIYALKGKLGCPDMAGESARSEVAVPCRGGQP